MSNTIVIGEHAEKLAEGFLHKKGLTTLTRNFRCRFGEIDLVMQDGETIVFVEVRFRSNNKFGGPLASITDAKRKRLLTTTQFYLQKNSRLLNRNQRFDVIGIVGQADRATKIEWIKNAIEAY